MNKLEVPLKPNGRYVIVARCSDGDVPLPGIVKRKCMRCNEECWLSPSMQKEKFDGIICGDCITEDDISVGIFGVTKESLEELRLLQWMNKGG